MTGVLSFHRYCLVDFLLNRLHSAHRNTTFSISTRAVSRANGTRAAGNAKKGCVASVPYVKRLLDRVDAKRYFAWTLLLCRVCIAESIDCLIHNRVVQVYVSARADHSVNLRSECSDWYRCLNFAR